MANFHFIDDPTVLDIINTILEAAGPNFAPPFDGTAQPYNGVEGNDDKLLKMNMPGGSELKGMAEPSNFGSIGTAINTLLMVFSPAFSAYALILPILGIILGILEVICALLNPFAIGPAVARLFSKWVPAFLSLLPPFAGGALIMNVIKVLMAVIFYILTVIVPTIQLIIDCFNAVAEVISDPNLPFDIRQDRLDLIEEKITSIVETLIQKIGVLSILLPIIELVFLILRLLTGFPCEQGPPPPRAGANLLSIQSFAFPDGLDTYCCDELCPDILSDRTQQPSGIGVLIPSFYGDCAPGFVFQLITSDPRVQEFEQYTESWQEQLNCQLDEPIKFARPPGATQDRSLIKVRLTSRRGDGRTLLLPALDINGTVVKITSPLAFLFLGAVDYTIVPDYDMLLMQGILTAGCHPDVREVKDDVRVRFADISTPFIERVPEVAPVFEDTTQLFNDLNDFVNLDLQACIDSVLSRTDPNDVQEDIQCANDVQNAMIDRLNNFLNDITDVFNSVLNTISDTRNSILSVDRATVTADADDFATISVVVRDVTSTSILRNLPNNTGINVDIFSDFGVLTDPVLNTSTGVYTAELRSPTAGTANITAKVNGELIVEELDASETAVRQVRFTQEAVLPTRRRKTKPSSGAAITTGIGSERETGNR